MERKKYEKVLLKDKTIPIVSEAYRNLRTNLMFMMSSQGYKSILFASSLPSEGKSTSCANLAISFAKTGKNVLIIDADLRNPYMNKLFLVNRAPGLCDVLANFSELNTCIKKTFHDNISLLPTGTIPPNPSELLISDKFPEVIQKLTNRFDIVFIDTPPVGLFTDAITIACHTDAVVLVTLYGKSTKESLQIMIDKFKKVEANIIGAVINCVKKKRYYELTGSKKAGRYLKNYSYGDS